MDNRNFSPVLTLEQVSEYLQLTPDEVSAELERGGIPGRKLAGQWRVRLKDLERLFESAFSAGEPVNATAPSNDIQQAIPLPTVPEPASAPQQNGIDLSTPRIEEQHIFEENGAFSASKPIDEVTSSTPELPAHELEHTKNGSDTSSIEQQTVSPPAPASPTDRVRARIYVSNHDQKYGYARLSDNQVILLDYNHLVQPSPRPMPGDTVEFELHQTRKGSPRARSIRIVQDDNVVSVPTPQKAQAPATDISVQQPTLPTTASGAISQSSGKTPKNHIPVGGTPAAQSLYREAAIASTEKRFNDARRLFWRAIEAGAGTQVYSVFAKMERELNRPEEARAILRRAIQQFPDQANYYNEYGRIDLNARNYRGAEEIFRKGLTRLPNNGLLKQGLAQTLVQINTEASLREAGEIFDWLKGRGQLQTDDRLYQRFKALQRSPRANKSYDFFQAANMRVGIAGRRDLPGYITDIVFETNNPELSESFGMSGGFLVRCFQRQPRAIEIHDLGKYLRDLGSQSVIGLQEGREVVLNTSVAFIAVPSSDAIRDQVMSILSENNEAIVPLDDDLLSQHESPLQALRDMLSQYLGRRDLYSSTMAVCGRRFFGREQLLRQLTDEVYHGQFVGIYGLRKIGKTSLIYQLRDEKLCNEALAYVDLQASQAPTLRNCAPLYWELERDLYVRLREHAPHAAAFMRLGKVERFSELPDNGEKARLIFAEDMRTLLDTLSEGKLPSIKRVVIVLDELERLLPVAGQVGIQGYIEFFGLLRGLAQTERYRGLLSSVVVAANAAISERGYWEGRENPVFALYKPVFLPPFSQAECEEMIRTLGKSMSVYWEDNAIQTIFAETSGHPFLTRSLCSWIARQYPTRPLTVTTAMVQEQILPFTRNESDKLKQITELLRANFPEEEKILLQVALDEAPANLPDEALRHLLNYGLIAEDTSGYRVTLNLLRRWLRRQKGILE